MEGKCEVIAFGDERVEVVLTRSAEEVTLALRDRANGCEWGPVPLLALEVHDKCVRRTDRFEKLRVDAVERVGGGVRVTVGHGAHIAASLWIAVDRGEMVVRLVPDEVYERRADVFRLFAIDILPGLFTVGGKGSRLLLPINQGMLCDPSDKPELADRFLLYMEQARWELTTMMPVCGAHGPKGGVVILASGVAEDAECRVATDGKGNGRVGFAFSLRRHWPDPVDPNIRELRYSLLKIDADLVFAAARRARRHAIEDFGKATLEERRKQSPEVAYLLDAYIMKLFYGIENEGYLADQKFAGDKISYRDYMTFAEAGDGLRRLKAAGVDKILTESVGWNPRGHDGLYPSRFPINERAGGEAGFRTLIAEGNAMGYHMNVHDNYMMNVPHSPDWDADCVVQDIHGEPLAHGWWAGGVEYASWCLALPRHRLEGHIERIKELGLKGMYYVDYMMQPLEVNYHPRHRGPRGDYNRGMLRVLKAGREAFGSVATEMGSFRGAVAADCITNCGGEFHLKTSSPDWPITRLFGPVVPVWPIAFSGLTVLEGHPGISWKGAMECVLQGRHPRDEWSARPGMHPVIDAARVKGLAAIYGLCVRRFGHLRLQEITACDWSGDQRRTVFADGTTVEADFSKMELAVDGKKIAKPEGLE